MTEIVMMAYDVLEAFIKDPLYQEMKNMKKKIDTQYQKEIQAFHDAQQIYDKIMSEGGFYHPDFKQAAQKLSEAKKNLYEQEEVTRYFTLEKTIQAELNEWIQQFASTISAYIPTPNELGITKKGGHHHGHK